MQHQKGGSNQTSQNSNQASLPKNIPDLMQNQPVETHKGTIQQNQLPNWMESGKTSTLSSQPEQNSRMPPTKVISNQQQRTAVSASGTKQLPKWLQAKQGLSNQHQPSERNEQEEKKVPNWLQEKLEKTEQDVKQEAAKKALEAQTKQIPKWLQEKVPKSSQAEAVTYGQQAKEKQIPKWLSKDKPSVDGSQTGDQLKQHNIPKWLQSKTTAAPVSNMPTISSGTC